MKIEKPNIELLKNSLATLNNFFSNADFIESKHLRDSDGKFTEGGGDESLSILDKIKENPEIEADQMKYSENQNAKSLPEIYYCKHMLPGICTYENESVYVDVDTLKKMNKSFAGKPVYLDHQDVNLDTLENDMDGVVSESFYNEYDGCLWAKFIVTTDKAKKAIKKDFSVSNAYSVTKFGTSGLHNNTEYNREILEGVFNHLAIVENPRYEKAKIYTPEEYKEYQQLKKAELEELSNSKQTAIINNNNKGKTMFKLFKNTREEVSEIDSETLIELENGKTVSVSEMINAVKKNQEEEKKEEKKEEKINEDMEVEVGEEKMPLKELINKYKNMCEDKENEMKEKEEKENEEEEKKKEEEKENSKHVKKLLNAREKFEPKTIEFSGDKVARGSQLYGSNK